MSRRYATPLIEADRALHRVREMGVELPAPEGVRAYLAHHPDVVSPVAEVCELARGLFPAGTRMHLELYQDPEIDDEYLALYARPPCFDASSYGLFRTVQRQRAPLMRDVSGKMMVLPDFISAD